MPEMTLSGACVLFSLLFLAAFVDSAAGGGALISLPAYLLTGMPIHSVYGTNKFTAGMAALFSTGRYLRSGKILLLPTACACLGAVLGSWLGASLVLLIDEALLRTTLLVLLPIAGVFIVLNQRKPPEAQERKALSRRVTVALSLTAGFLCGLYDGFFGPGTGTFLILAFNGILGMEIVTAAGSARTVNLAANAAALLAYMAGDKVVWAVAIPGAVFSVLGGQMGTFFAVKQGARLIRPLMVAVVVLLMAKVAWDFFGG